jgi:homogentisate 1,2-dioxygenase
MEGSPRTGCNLHNTSSAHGPSSDITKHGHSDDAPVGPVRALEDTWMLMFETYLPLNTTQWAMG